jgi:quercetin dioxygenase-like cupin family protein
MINKSAKPLAAALLVAAGLSGFAAPAFAGECPAGQMRAGAMSGGPTMPKDVTDTVLGTVDLTQHINVDGRSLRMRRLVLQPGGIVPMHSHADRPALIITVSGEVTEHRSNCAKPIVHKAGELSRETADVEHWWQNSGKTEAVLLSADVHNDK